MYGEPRARARPRPAQPRTTRATLGAFRELLRSPKEAVQLRSQWDYILVQACFVPWNLIC